MTPDAQLQESLRHWQATGDPRAAERYAHLLERFGHRMDAMRFRVHVSGVDQAREAAEAEGPCGCSRPLLECYEHRERNRRFVAVFLPLYQASTARVARYLPDPSPLFVDGWQLHGAMTTRGYLVHSYDDGLGELWAYWETHGVVGVVRAKGFSDAWDVVLDEILPPIPMEEVHEAYGLDSQSALQAAYESRQMPDIVEGYDYQPNATGSGIVQVDRNHGLNLLTAEILEHSDILIDVGPAE